MKRDYTDYLHDILNEIHQIESFISGIDLKSFSSDTKTYYAVLRALEVIGEASGKIPKEIKENYNHIPWQEMYGMRNKLIHDYFGVNESVIWKTITEDLPPLKNDIALILKEAK
jgi:uncharacterized protein with HEPN domain